MVYNLSKARIASFAYTFNMSIFKSVKLSDESQNTVPVKGSVDTAARKKEWAKKLLKMKGDWFSEELIIKNRRQVEEQVKKHLSG
jgi:hypothetical protein